MQSDLFFANKPSGLPSHRAHAQGQGFCEWLQIQHGRTLRIVQRLDRDTTGAMVFAQTEAAAAELTELFTQHRVQKKYLFVTDRAVKQTRSEVRSHIVKEKNRFVSHPASTDYPENATTRFTHLRSEGRFSLWQAEPQTGKPHQIRLHAESVGIPILGDQEHGGSVFTTLMLHCKELSFKWHEELIVHSCSEPLLMQNLKWLNNSLLSAWLSDLDRRQRLTGDLYADPTQCLRLANQASDGVIDRFGDVLWLYRFSEKSAQEDESLEVLKKVTRCKQAFTRQMNNRGTSPQKEDEAPFHWHAKEDDVTYLLASHRGWSPGLFLDQRENRRRVKNQAQNLRVLNLFCYTAGFSVCAALGGAREVVSVDTSTTTLEWAKENFRANQLDPEKFEFWSSDARLFLQGCHKRARKFDLIICDPPSFARNKNGIFRLEEELGNLLHDCARVLAPQGRILFSCNLEKWDHAELAKRISNSSAHLLIEGAGGLSADFVLDQEILPMKSYWLKSRSS